MSVLFSLGYRKLQMCDGINSQPNQDKHILQLEWCVVSRILDRMAPTNAVHFPTLERGPSLTLDVKLKAGVLVRGDGVWQRHYLA